MNRAIYPILSGAVAQEKQLQVFANNLANVNTAGFKQDQQGFRGLLARAGSPSVISSSVSGITSTIASRPTGPTERVFVEPHGVRTAFEPGRIRITGNPLDLALQGKGFFEVKTPEGIRYTRNGMFSLDNQRRLATNVGHVVMGTKGEIKVPPGTVQINAQGTIQVDGNQIGTIKVVEFPDAQMPQKFTEGLFMGGEPKVSADPQLQSGHIEESNVNSLGEMVKMIQGMRSYESAQKLIQTLDNMTQTAIQDLGRVQ
ncbi:MAG: Flagellar basal-body rod protein FlgF [Nitrospira sp.]|jgi:flagellar basal-body rod protein FlgG|nr:MAG: Flagellar basal-body rod protein FlgF [Nitrospira sp.]